MKTNIEVLFSLLRNIFLGGEVDDEIKNAVIENTDELYKLSKSHDISHLVSYVIEKNEIELNETELSKKFRKRHPIAVIRYEELSAVYRQLCKIFEEEKIPFIPLKGAVIRDLYPEPWMRTSCDIDVLVHKEDFDKASGILVNEFGFEKKDSSTHDVSYFAPNGTNVELHFNLSEIDYENSASSLLEKVWDYADLKDDSKYMYTLKDEFFYMFHVYHMAKHFEIGGCGLRPFLDLWLLDTGVLHDEEKRNELLSEIGLLTFANSCRELSRYWFSEGESNDMILRLQKFILDGGVYGNADNRHSVKQVKTENRVKHILGRIFLSYDKLKIKYPIVEKHKLLIPYFQVKRWFKLTNPKYRAIARDNLKSVAKPDEETSRDMTEFLKYMGLK